MRALIDEWPVTPEHDPKLQPLKAMCSARSRNPINPGNRKVLIFTAFADTADYLYPDLAPAFTRRWPPTGHRHRQGRAQDDAGQGLRLPEILTLFSPRSKEKRLVMPQARRRDRHPDRHRLHLRRPEPPGLRLPHQLRHPLEPGPHHPALRPHRPHRLHQRQHPARQLLARHHARRVHQPQGARREPHGDRRRRGHRRRQRPHAAEQRHDLSPKEQLRRLQEEVIELEDVRTGVSITDLGLNDFRMDLLNYVKEYGDLASSPRACTRSSPPTRPRACAPA